MRKRGDRFIKSTVALLFLLLLCRDVLSQGILIREIIFKGNRKVSEKTLRELTNSEEGKELDQRVIRDDVKKIFQTGYFSDVKVDADITGEGVNLTYILKEKPVVFKVSIKGNEEVETDEIMDLIPVKEREFYSDAKVKETERKIIEIYNNLGYFDVVVTTELTEREGGRIGIHFDIQEGDKVKITAIEFEGNNFFTTKELRKAINTKKKGFLSFLTDSGSFKKDVFENDLKLIEVMYLDNGFLDVKVGKPKTDKHKEGIRITIDVFEGIQYRVGKVTLSGDVPEDEEGLLSSLKTKSYQTFSREKMVGDILDITRNLQDTGFADASVSPSYSKQERYPVVDINFSITKGRKYRFGLVNIKGNTKTIDKVVRRRLEVADGEVYSASGLERSKAELMRVGYFKDVKIITKKGKEEDEIDVEVEVEEGNTGTISGGLGFSSVDQFFGTLQVSENNLLGRGWKLGLNTQFGTRRLIFDINFREPNLFDSRWSFRVDAYNTSVEFDEYTRDAAGGRIGFGYPVFRNVNTGLSLRLDKVRIVDVTTTNPNSPILREAEKGAQNTHSITWDIDRNTTDSYINPTRGSSQGFSIEYAGGILGGDSDFVKYFVNDRHFKPIVNGVVYALNVEWGHAVSTVGGAVPLFERFFLGGPYTIRGFESRSISPVDPNTGEKIGGNKQLVINNELLITLYEEIGLKWVFFVDIGNTWGQDVWPDSFTGLTGLRYGAGFGLRWYSPMGPLRLEWGWNLDPAPDEPRRVVEFTIGTVF